MSMSTSLSNAISGLSAVSRAAELVSANVANAMTEGYGRRELSLSAATVGGQGAGVQIVGVERMVNQAALTDRRISEADLGFHQTNATFFSTAETLIGTPEKESSLSAHMNQFEESLLSVAGNPSSTSRLSAVVNDATSLAAKINTISDKFISEREQADRSIGEMVETLNASLTDVDQLNREIRVQVNSGGDASGLMDQRQVIIDQISSLVPIQEVARDYGQVALVTANGTTLVDYQAAQFNFTPTPIITPDMSLASGALSGLEIIGASSVNGSASDSVAGGALAAAFNLRDVEIPALQADLDSFARDLIDRSALADPTLASGQPGIFTDADQVLDPLDEAGLASRLSVNSRVVPSEGGDLWRLRDGLGATVPGPVSDHTTLSALEQVFSTSRTPASGTFSGGSSAELIAELISDVGQSRQTSEQRQGFASTKVQAFRDVEQSAGVDTDQEMQKLLLIERNFAANAKVIQAVDEMLQSLLRI